MFKKAAKTQSYARLGIYALSGGGKTLSALRIAKGLGGSIALIDSERGSASKCIGHPAAPDIEFDVCELEDLTIRDYLAAINFAARSGYGNLIIDSATHAWRELLVEVEEIAQRSFKGNTWAAWSKGTPMQSEFVNAILRYPGHVIVTMRSKTEWTLGDTRKPQRVGLSPDQGKGIEYEFDMLISIDSDHSATIEKDRTGKFQDKRIKLITEEFGATLGDWLSQGRAVETSTFAQREEFDELVARLGFTEEQVNKAIQNRGVGLFNQLTVEKADEMINSLKMRLSEKEEYNPNEM